jgi:hypothetical protein
MMVVRRVELGVLAVSCVLILATLCSAAPQEEGPLRRFLLAVGSSEGGSRRAELRYALSDAEAVATVFRELGGVASADEIVLRNPDRRQLLESFRNVGLRLAVAERKGTRFEVIVYYSGHSDETGILLGDQHVSYGEIKSAVEGLPAGLSVTILDSCASGSLTRLKGGERRPLFVLDESPKQAGRVFITSASENEVAQESDRLRSSFFTHAFIAGLRGAADVSRDGRVTLSEAYEFTRGETVARTSETLSGVQHPMYDMQLVGSGEVVMTDLRGSSSRVVLDESLSGRLFVQDATNTVIVELGKPAGQVLALALDPGDYRFVLWQPDTIVETRARLSRGRILVLTREMFRGRRALETAIRGAPSAIVLDPDFPGPWKTSRLGVVLALTLGRLRYSSGAWPESMVSNGMSTGFLAGVEYLRLLRQRPTWLAESGVQLWSTRATTDVDRSRSARYTWDLTCLSVPLLLRIPFRVNDADAYLKAGPTLDVLLTARAKVDPYFLDTPQRPSPPARNIDVDEYLRPVNVRGSLVLGVSGTEARGVAGFVESGFEFGLVDMLHVQDAQVNARLKTTGLVLRAGARY